MEDPDRKPEVLTPVPEPCAGRREALMRIGRYGAYVTPAVLALTLGKRAEAYCSICGKP